MLRLLPAIPGLLLILLAAPDSRADVLILRGNDVPLTGRIVKEDGETIRFQIKGLGSSSFVDIEKSRVTRFWREENTYWEYLAGQKTDRDLLLRLGGGEPGEDAPAGAVGESPGPADAPAPAPPPGASHRPIRDEILSSLSDRLERVVPDGPPVRMLLFGGLYAGMVLLIRVGGRVADLPRLTVWKAAVLGVISAFFGVLAWKAAVGGMTPGSMPFVVTGEVLAWVLIARVLCGGGVSKAVLLLSFLLASVFLLAATVFAVMVAI